MMGLAQGIWWQAMDATGVPSDGKYKHLCGCTACTAYRTFVKYWPMKIRPAEQHSGPHHET
jgi:hypothetical protein